MPLERAINGVPGMKYMSSDAGNDGVGVVQILFEIGTDPDVAAINVQNRVNSVMGALPEEVIRNGVKIAKEENAMLLYLSLFSEDPDHDEKFLYNFADINVLAEIKRIPGVGFADIMGAKEYAIRIWLKPDRMALYDVSAEDVLDALEAANVEAAPGKVGENSDRGRAPLQYTLKYTGKFNDVEQYGQIPVRSTPDGERVRIRDVADVEFGTMYFDVEAKYDGRPAASILLKQQPGSNAREVIAQVKERMEVLQRDVFLPGMSYAYSFDVSRFLDASVHEVVKTLVEAFLLVALVVYLFLADGRSMVISIVAVPVSLVGTLLFLYLTGFSLNLITLFALVLAIGIVVDNAIVVVEAVHHKMTHQHLGALRATEQAMGEIGGAIVAITLVMGSVFVPLAFVEGPAGIFYRQFALTMAVAITLSGGVALTLTPAMCATLLRGHGSGGGDSLGGRVLRAFESTYQRAEGRFGGFVERMARRPLLTWASLAGVPVATLMLARAIPTGFIPSEDQGIFNVSITTPPGATLERTKEVVNAVVAEALRLEGVESVASLSGTNVLSDGTGATYGTCIVNLAPWEQRDRSTMEICRRPSRGNSEPSSSSGSRRRPVAPPSGVQQFEAELAETRAEALATTQRIVELEARINLLVGRAPQPVARTPEALARGLAPPALGVPSDLLRRRPDVLAAEQAVAATGYDVAAARAAFLPSLTLTGALGLAAFDPRYLLRPESAAYGLAGGLAGPLLNRSALRAELGVARADQVEAMVEYQRVLVTSVVEVENHLSGLQRSVEIVQERERQRQAAARAVETSESLFVAGKATHLDVLVAQQGTLEAELDLVEASLERQWRAIGLYRALGGGWPEAPR